VYNRAVAYSRNPNSSQDLSILFDKYHVTDKYTMRNLFVTKKGSENTLNDWEFNTPKDIRAGSINEFTTSLKTNMIKVATGKISHFKLQFKSHKKKRTESISLPKSSIHFSNKDVKIYPSYMKETIKIGKRSGKKYPKIRFRPDMDSRLIYDGQNYFLLIPRKVNVKNKIDEKKAVALDPGVRTFQTGFSESEFFESKINKTKYDSLKNKIKLIQSLYSKNQNSNYRKKIVILHKKIKNLINECHWQTASYLVNNYNDVLLPSFESQEMVKKGYLSKKTKDEMLNLSHFLFKTRLIEKTQEFKNFRIHHVNEAYTSKTCSCCGKLNNCGSSKIYKCESCSLIMDRDVNGARNIFIKHASLVN
jgi:putative transposase